MQIKHFMSVCECSRLIQSTVISMEAGQIADTILTVVSLLLFGMMCSFLCNELDFQKIHPHHIVVMLLFLFTLGTISIISISPSNHTSNIFALSCFISTFSGCIIFIYFFRSWSNEGRTCISNYWIATQYVPHDLRHLCLVYIGMNVKSHILTISHQYQLHSFLLQHFKDMNRWHYFKFIDFSLLYSSSDTAFNQQLFFKSCLGHKNILIVMHTRYNQIIGGFMSIGIHQIGSWRWITSFSYLGFDSYLQDDKAFLYRLQPSPKIFKVNPKKVKLAVHLDKKLLFEFGERTLFCNYIGEGTLFCNSVTADLNSCAYDIDESPFFKGSSGQFHFYEYVEMIELHQVHL
eukprot:129369_1